MSWRKNLRKILNINSEDGKVNYNIMMIFTITIFLLVFFQTNLAVSAVDTTAPVITNVTIPNSAMKIDDVVTATITANDDGDLCTLQSGAINGFPLGSLTRTTGVTVAKRWDFTAGVEDFTGATNHLGGFGWQADGTIGATITNTDAYFRSANIQAQGINITTNKYIKLSYLNNTSSTAGEIFFTTDTDGAWNGSKRINFTLSANDLSFKEYIIDMSTVPLWTGTLKELRVDTSNNVTSGTFNIDYIQIQNNPYSTYTATFTVASGGTDLNVGDNIPISNLVLRDPSLNNSSPYATAISQDGDKIDANRPTVIGATLDYGTGVLVVRCSENVKASLTDPTKFHINNVAGSDVVTLSAAPDNVDSSILTFTLTEAQRLAALAISGVTGGDTVAVVLDVDANAIADIEQKNLIDDDNNSVTEMAIKISPVITNVEIPNLSMKVGDVVTATITVNADTDTYTLVSGTVAGFPLGNLNKTSDTTYTATFTVTSDGTDVAVGSDITASVVLRDTAGNNSNSWTPADITTSVWLDAADASTITQLGGLVSQWNDKSGYNRHYSQGTDGKKPTSGTVNINGKNVLLFDNADIMDQASGVIANNNFSAIFVARPDVTHEIDAEANSGTTGIDGEKYLLFPTHAGFNTIAGWGLSLGTNGISAYEHTSDYLPPISVFNGAISDYKVIVGKVTNNQTAFYMDSNLVYTGLTSPKNTVQISGLLGNGGFGGFDGKLAECLIISGVVGDIDRRKIEGYLAHKWGLATNLPDDHPYKSSAPGGASNFTISQGGDSIDVNGPIDSNGWPKVDTATVNAFTVRSKINESGTAYYVVLANGAAAPTSAQVKVGNAANNAPAPKSGSIALSANTEGTNTVNALTRGTTYNVYVACQDTAGNLQSSPTRIDIATKPKSYSSRIVVTIPSIMDTTPIPTVTATPMPTSTPTSNPIPTVTATPMPTSTPTSNPIPTPTPKTSTKSYPNIIINGMDVEGVYDNQYFNEWVYIKNNNGKVTLNGFDILVDRLANSDGKYVLSILDSDGNVKKVYNFILDTERPKIKGFVYGSDYNTDVTITFDEGEGKLNGKVIQSGYVVNTEGEYNVEVVDKAGNKTSSIFFFDKTPPLINGVTEGMTYTSSRKIDFNEGFARLNDKEFYSGDIVSDKGDYILSVTDYAGNMIEVRFAINNSSTMISGVVNGGVYKASVDITIEGGTAYLDGKLVTGKITETSEGTHKIVSYGSDGKTETLYFRIDNTSPKLVGVEDGGIYNKDVYVAFNEGSGKLDDFPYTEGDKISEDGKHTLVVADSVGNFTRIAFEIDKKSPEIKGVEEGKTYNNYVVIDFNEGNGELNGVNFVSGEKATLNGEHELIVKDKAGNTSAVKFKIEGMTLAQQIFELIKKEPSKTEYYKIALDIMKEQNQLNSIKMFVNGEMVDFGKYNNVEAKMIDGRAFVPVKAVADYLGFKTVWNGSTKEITTELNDLQIILSVNSNLVKIGNEIMYMDIPVIEENGISLIPVRFISEIFKRKIYWVSDTTATGAGIVAIYSTGSSDEIQPDDITSNIKELIAKIKPYISGVLNDSFYNTDLNIKIAANKAYLDGSVDSVNLSKGILSATLDNNNFNGGKVSDEGRHVLVASISGGGTESISFTIDKTPPKVTGVENGKIYEEGVTVHFDETLGILNGKYISSGERVENNGYYKLLVSDKANNITIVSFGIKKTGTNVDQSGIYNTDIKLSIEKDVKVTINGKDVSGQIVLTDEGVYDVRLIKADGTESSFTIKIDKTSPVVYGVENGLYYRHGVKVTFNEGYAIMDGEVFDNGQLETREGLHKLIVTDEAGNSNIIEFVIDRTPPIIYGIKDGKTYDEPELLSYNEGEGTINGNPFTIGENITEVGEYFVEVADKAGNKTNLRFKMEELTVKNVLAKIKKDPRREKLYPISAKLMKKENITGILLFTKGNLVDFGRYDNVQPVIKNGRTLVPIRAVSEAINSFVNWDASQNKINLKLNNKEIELKVNSKEAIVNGKKINLDVAPIIENGRALVPLRFISETYGLNVNLFSDIEETRIIAIY